MMKIPEITLSTRDLYALALGGLIGAILGHLFW